jgi:hypothetical protein
MNSKKRVARLATKTTQYLVVMVLLVAVAGSATYAVMSDTSIHGLTVRFYNNVSRGCLNATTAPVLKFSFYGVVIYSTSSLETYLSHVRFTLSTDGNLVGTIAAADSKFGPGQSFSYYLTFTNATLDPRSQPFKSNILLGITASVSAGLYSSLVTASDSELVIFPGPAC